LSAFFRRTCSTQRAFGLLAVKNVGQGAIESIIGTPATGPFRSLVDFCGHIDTRLANKRVLESLAKVGALNDELGYLPPRACSPAGLATPPLRGPATRRGHRSRTMACDGRSRQSGSGSARE
jgi:Helix-hairpin-helix motif